MDRRQRMIRRFRTDYDFMTIITAVWSLFVSVIFALYNGVLGIHYASLWHGSICVYYLLLVVIRGTVIIAERKIAAHGRNESIRQKVDRTASWLLLILNLSLIVPVTIMVKQQKPVNMTMIASIGIAAYTTYNVIMALINFRRSRNSGNCLVRLLRKINLIDALVSILSLQNTLIMVNSNGDSIKMMPVSAGSSAVIWIIILFISVRTLIQGGKVPGK